MNGLDISHLANLLKDSQRTRDDSDSDEDQVCEKKKVYVLFDVDYRIF